MKPRTQEMKGKKVYIGQTGRHPLTRFLQHKLGYKTTQRSNVRQLGVGLIEISEPLSSSDEAIAEEKRYSEIIQDIQRCSEIKTSSHIFRDNQRFER